jgi:hypothetical protein
MDRILGPGVKAACANPNRKKGLKTGRSLHTTKPVRVPPPKQGWGTVTIAARCQSETGLPN